MSLAAMSRQDDSRPGNGGSPAPAFGQFLLIFLVILALLVAHRVLTPHPIHIKSDEIYNWWTVITFPDRETAIASYRHHDLRWGMLVPGIIAAEIFGTQASAYYIAPMVLSAVAISLAIVLCLQLSGPAGAITAAFFLLVNPEIMKLTMQMMPAPFSMFYIILSAFLFTVYVRTQNLWYLAAGTVVMFCAYGAKITNVFFLPFVVIYLWCVAPKRHFFIAAGVFSLLLIAEAGAIYVLSGGDILGGRIEALAGGEHVQVMSETLGLNVTDDKTLAEYSFSDLFARWYQGVPAISRLLYFLFFGCAIVAALNAKRLPREMAVLVLMGASFVVFTTFFVISVDPLRPGQTHRPRYLVVLAPVAAVVVGWYVSRALDWVAKSSRESHRLSRWAGAAWSSLHTVYFGTMLALLGIWFFMTAVIAEARYSYGVLSASNHFRTVSKILQAGCPIHFDQNRYLVGGLKPAWMTAVMAGQGRWKISPETAKNTGSLGRHIDVQRRHEPEVATAGVVYEVIPDERGGVALRLASVPEAGDCPFYNAQLGAVLVVEAGPVPIPFNPATSDFVVDLPGPGDGAISGAGAAD